MKELSIIIPAYNESDRIVNTIETIHSVFRNEQYNDYEIIIVDDGSTDGMFHKLIYRKDVVSIRVETNLGKGNAIRQGFNHAMGKYICFFDADLDIHPQHIPYLLYFLKVESNKYDVLLPIKWSDDSESTVPITRKIMSYGYYMLCKLLFKLPYRDTQTGLKMFKYSSLYDVMPYIKSRRFEFDVELLINLHKQGCIIKELPVKIIHRRKSRISPLNIFHILKETLIIWYRLSFPQ